MSDQLKKAREVLDPMFVEMLDLVITDNVEDTPKILVEKEGEDFDRDWFDRKTEYRPA